MIDKDLLDILACPQSHQGLREATATDLAALNARIGRKELRSAAGKTIDAPLQGALIREDGKRLYPIVDGIPVLLVDEGVEL